VVDDDPTNPLRLGDIKAKARGGGGGGGGSGNGTHRIF